MITITLRQLKKPPAACGDRYKFLLSWLGHHDLDRPIPLTDILEHNGLADVEWVLDTKLPALLTEYARQREPLWAAYERQRESLLGRV